MDEVDGVARRVNNIFNAVIGRIRNPSGQSKSESVLDSGQPPITVSPSFIKGLDHDRIKSGRSNNLCLLGKEALKAEKGLYIIGRK